MIRTSHRLVIPFYNETDISREELTMRPAKWKTVVGWVLTILIFLLLIGPSAMGKLMDWEGKEAMFTAMGFSVELMRSIGYLELTLAILLVIPQTSFLAAILLTGYLGGATVTHLRVGEAFFMPIVIGIVMWIALGLRRPEIFRLAWGTPTGSPPASAG